MPIYEYRCEACGQQTEALQRLADPPLSECPHCGGPLRKMISAPAFQFKGTGWYVTDYARKGSSGDPGGAASGDKGGDKAADKGAGKAAGKAGDKAAKGGDKPVKSAGSSGSAKE